MHLQERRTLNQKLFFAWKIWEREAAPACLDRLSWVSKQDAHVPFGPEAYEEFRINRNSGLADHDSQFSW